ncbi:nuclease [Paenibacillus darwinianus]|uniref:Nuclease n=1 Tax=Paenibacillus darwinianus TaxID=1380763 RepID=A0A9W5S1A4_9BACL|nr:thermonuclease family protein [Paenibacillus darwinianus]EXX88088.1 nuclease [Paenibacillus darwinianus]EXX88372.1 nuclease [Paenibacillus darwinianus]
MRQAGATRTALLLFAIVMAQAFFAACGASQTSVGPADWESVLADYPELEGRQAEQAIVRRIVDGDTFETVDGRKIRLIGVNTPETFGKPETFGEEAKAFALSELQDRRVWMFKDISETDRYGRLLRFVFVQGEREMFNERLIREGYARVMTYPPDVTYAERFVRGEREARANDRGLWRREPSRVGGKSADAEAPAVCKEPLVKGNINSRGAKIYHVPGSPQYNQTKAERMFCTAEEAEAEGFRAPK